jgi:hypothetical protein
LGAIPREAFAYYPKPNSRDLNLGPTFETHTYQYHLRTYGPNVVYDDFIQNFTTSVFDPKEVRIPIGKGVTRTTWPPRGIVHGTELTSALYTS